MVPRDAPIEKTERLSFSPTSPEFGAIAKQRFEELSQIQSEVLDEIREANQNLFDRIQSEAILASDLTFKLASSHSISETTNACQEWSKRRMELFTEDNKRIVADSQKFLERAARFLSNRWLSNGPTAGGT